MWKSLIHIKCGTTETIYYTNIGTLCRSIDVQTVQKGRTRNQHNNKWVQPMKKLFHCTYMITWYTKHMKEISRQQSCYHSRRNSISFMEICAISFQSCWIHFKRDWIYHTVKVHTMVEGTTMALTGAIHLTYNWDQNTNRQTCKSEMCKLHVCNLKEISHRYFAIWRISSE